MKKRRIRSNDLIPWFLEDHRYLPESYLKKCRKFFDEIKQKKN